MKKPSPVNAEDQIAALLARLSASRKYRALDIPEATLRDLVEKTRRTHSDPRQVEKVIRHKLHNLVAPYLGDPDYLAMRQALTDLPRDQHAPELMEWCLRMLNAHASTRERLPVQQAFYKELIHLTGTPNVVLDLACGLNPFALPWMGLPSETRYYACDLHRPRVDLIDAFLKHVRQPGAAYHQDILVEPPEIVADVVFFFKEAHRFDQREPGVNRLFFSQLRTRWLLVSLPTVSLSGQRSMLESDRRLVTEACAERDWQVREMLFDREIVFCIRVRA